MKKTADVLEIMDTHYAKVMLYKHVKCTGCGFCNKAMHPGSIVKAKNPIGAKAKDKVSVIVLKKFNVLEFITMYILPTLMFLAGLWVGSMLIPMGAPDFTGVLLAVLMLAAAIVIYMKTKHLFFPVFNIKIVKILIV